MKPSMNVIRQLNLKRKEKFGDCEVILTNLHNALWVLIPVYFAFRNIKIHEMVALCRKKKNNLRSDQNPHFKSKYILE